MNILKYLTIAALVLMTSACNSNTAPEASTVATIQEERPATGYIEDDEIAATNAAADAYAAEILAEQAAKKGKTFEEEYEEQYGYPPASLAALESGEQAREDAVVANQATASGWNPPATARANNLPANSPEFEKRLSYYQNALRNGSARISEELELTADRRHSTGELFYYYRCRFDADDHEGPQQCGTNNRYITTDRNLNQFLVLIDNETLLKNAGTYACTPYACIRRDNGTLVGAPQPLMYTWLQQNCTVYTNGTFVC